jgi:hypothetical protein
MLLNNDLSTYIQSSHCNLKDEYQLLDGIYNRSKIFHTTSFFLFFDQIDLENISLVLYIQLHLFINVCTK